MVLKILFLFALVGFGLAANRTAKHSSKATIDIEYFYSVNNDKDGDFIVSQLIPEFQNLANSYIFLVFPIGNIQIITDDVPGKYHCTGKDTICETSLIHYCVEMNDNSILVNFLQCYFQSELYPVDLVGASEQCILQYDGQAALDNILQCSKDDATMANFAQTVFDVQKNYLPTFEQTPHIFLNEEYSSLAAIDLKKALCRVAATDIWQCESVDRYKEPKVEIFYSVYDQSAYDFFLNQLSTSRVQNVIDSVVELDIIPNPNKIVNCNQTDPSCWNHKAHWCIYINYAGRTQSEIIQCTFAKLSSISDEDKIQQCVPNYNEVKNCIDSNLGSSAINGLQSRLNLLIAQSHQQSVEVIIKDQSNVKVKNGIVQELCYNYFEIDNETLGCKVTKPKVQIFYESNSLDVEYVFSELAYQAKYAPFETLAEFEFIPYGQTNYVDGNYTCRDEFQCQANWVHACLLNRRFSTIAEQYQFFLFFYCASAYVTDKTPLDLAEECINQTYEDGPNLFPELLTCAEEDEELKEQLKNKTQAIGLSQVPEIVIDGLKRTSNVGYDLVWYLCRSFSPIKPRVCFDIDSGTSQTLQVSVFLTADQDSQAFVQSQIKPLVNIQSRDQNFNLRDVIEWKFVPWGPSEVNSTSGEVECINGEEECLANRILACATRQRQNGKLGIREDKQRVASFVVCFFDSANWQTNPLEAANLCSPKLSQLDNYPQLMQCAVQDSKLKLLLDMKALTDNNYPTISDFPAISIDGRRQNDINNLRKILCESYEASPIPVECNIYTITEIDIEYFYSVKSDKDGDFLISQLIPEFEHPTNNYYFFLYPIGDIQIISDPEPGKYYCTSKDSVCETSLIHFCVELFDSFIVIDFIKCYFQSELYPVDLVGASKQCFLQFDEEYWWEFIQDFCVKDEFVMSIFYETVLLIQNIRPLIEQTPYLLLDGEYSNLAGIDLKKALCRVKNSDIWQCESVDRYKEPKVEIFYTVYDEESNDFFSNQFTHAIAQKVTDTTVELDIIPNPNKIIDCIDSDDSCWSHKAHWCIYMNQAGTTQVDTIQCTFSKSSSTSPQDRVRECAPNIYDEIVSCVNSLGQANSIVKGIQTRLNLLIDQSQQQAIEVIIKDQSNVKAKNGILQEICYNYFEIDNETLGCKVTLPKVQIFYETQSSNVELTFIQFAYQAEYAPFETLAQFEFIPYGQTTHQDGNYICSNGEPQCQANWVHACLFNERYRNVDEQYQFIKFFSCATSYYENLSPLNIARSCINQIYDDGPELYQELLLCAQSNNDLKDRLRIITKGINPIQVPEIVIDGSLKTSEVGLDLLVYLCRSFELIKPRICFDIDTGLSQTLQVSVFLTADQSSQAFVQSQIKPLLINQTRDSSTYLRDAIEWNIVPWGPSVYNSTSGEVECANGEEECLANRILACATSLRQNGKLGIREDKLRVASFLVCFFDSANWQTNPLEAANLCSAKLSPLDTYPQLWQCAVQDSKLKVLLDMKTLTENNYPTITNFPALSIDQQRLEDISDLVKGLCSYYKASSRPAECQTEDTPTIPVGTTPVSTTPVSTTPTVTIPGITTPTGTTPTVTIPGITTPTGTTPTVTTPGSTASAGTTPTVTVPGITTPAITTPGVTVPGITTPAITTPGVTTPGGTMPTTPDPGSGTSSNHLSRIVMSIFGIWITYNFLNR